MTFATRLRNALPQATPAPVSGHWHTVSLCLDDTACEFLNVGVVFMHGGQVEVRMLDTFTRLQCLYDKRFNADNLQHLLIDIEHTLEQYAGQALPEALSDTIRIGPPLYAQGASAEAVVDDFFAEVVTLARPTAKNKAREFRYYASGKLRRTIIHHLAHHLGLDAQRIVQDHAYELRLSNGRSLDVDVPLLSGSAVGGIVSGWYKSPIVVEKNILQASQDLNLVATHSKRVPSISVLLPSKDSGLSHKERGNVLEASERQLERLSRAGMTILKGESAEELAYLTASWWQDRVA